LFIENPNIGQLSSMYMHAWKKGLKTTYYLRSRPATRIAKVTVETQASPATAAKAHEPAATAPAPAAKTQVDEAAAIACSLENPESCEACQ
jgi:ribonucleoside-diphosphate reductase alpha chain